MMIQVQKGPSGLGDFYREAGNHEAERRAFFKFLTAQIMLTQGFCLKVVL